MNFMSVNTALDLMIGMIETMEKSQSEFETKAKKYSENRPQNYQEFVQYLEENYVTVSFGEDGKIIEAMKMDGEKIDLEKITTQNNEL